RPAWDVDLNDDDRCRIPARERPEPGLVSRAVESGRPRLRDRARAQAARSAEGGRAGGCDRTRARGGPAGGILRFEPHRRDEAGAQRQGRARGDASYIENLFQHRNAVSLVEIQFPPRLVNEALSVDLATKQVTRQLVDLGMLKPLR